MALKLYPHTAEHIKSVELNYETLIYLLKTHPDAAHLDLPANPAAISVTPYFPEEDMNSRGILTVKWRIP